MDNNGNGHGAEYRFDAGQFVSSALGFGALNRDKLETFQIGARRKISPTELWQLYESNNFAANVIDAVPNAACQKYVEYESDSDTDVIQAELDKVRSHICQAWKLARLQGWAAVLLLIDDGERDYTKPVNTRNIRGISGYNALSGGNAGEISVFQWDEDPLSVTYSTLR